MHSESEKTMGWERLAAEIRAFCAYLAQERGLSQNTVQAYRRDLEHFCRWVTEFGLADWHTLPLSRWSEYLRYLRESGLASPSIARNLVAVKMFFRFLHLEGKVAQRTVELLSSPRLWQRIPFVLSPEAVEKLLTAPQADDRMFFRDRAILEMLYATGARASVAVWAKVTNSGSCRWVGKRSRPCKRIYRNNARSYAEPTPTRRGFSSAVPANR
jgi:integrase/recombinase XerD